MVALTAPSPAASVHVTAFNDVCDGSVEVGVGNPSTERLTVNVNTYLIDVPPRGMTWVTVPPPDGGQQLKVTVTTLTGLGADVTTHAWTRPGNCATTGQTHTVATTPARPDDLPATGDPVNTLSVAGIIALIIGIAMFLTGSRRRRAPRVELPRPSSAGLGFKARTFAIACQPQTGPYPEHVVGRARVPRHRTAPERVTVSAGDRP